MTTAPENRIVEHVLDAIADQKLRAGTKLGEQSLSEIFSCNRTQVRRALATLTGYQVVEHLPNRGAFVATPTEADARDVFEARRAIEATICANVVRNAKPADYEALGAHLEHEKRATAEGNRPEAIRLSRGFHLILARVGGNSVLTRYLEELTMRTSLILGLYADSTESLCAPDEHARILDALIGGDTDAAGRLLDAHLRHIEARLVFDGARKPLGALSALLGSP
jgi:DNA-binding GntR family transcriptional regulator